MRSSAAKGAFDRTTGYLLARACKAHRGSVGAVLAEVGLHVGQEMVLLHLWRQDGLTPSELAERLGVEPPTVTNMLSRMEKAGLLERCRDTGDARCTRVYLTEKGRELREPVEHPGSGGAQLPLQLFHVPAQGLDGLYKRLVCHSLAPPGT